MSKAPLYNALIKYKEDNKIRLHMPGHGGKQCGELTCCAAYDVTELCETDNLFDAKGVILKAEQLAAKAFNARHTLFSAGGATLCIMAAIAQAAGKGSKIAADRNCHKSVLHAAILLSLEVVWIYENDNIEDILKDSGVKAVIFTSPLYTGEIIDIKGISEVCKKYNCMLIVDNSHGGHLAFYMGGCLHPNNLGADYVIDSAHKTLPVLTGGAYLHTMHDDYYSLKEKMALFGSTSPSYLIMASLDFARDVMQQKGEELLNELLKNINEAKKYIEENSFIRFNENSDPFRIAIKVQNAEQVFNELYEKGISCEGVINGSIVAIPSVYTEKRELMTFAKELCNILKNAKPLIEEKKYLIKSAQVMSVRDAFFAEYEEIDINKSENKIAARPVIFSLPSVPLLMCGELITKEHISLLKDKVFTIKVIKEENS